MVLCLDAPILYNIKTQIFATMKSKFKLLILLTFFTGYSVQINAQCVNVSNIYTFEYNGHTYEMVKENKTWANAAACAVERGGYLVEITDAAEQDSIFFEAILSLSILKLEKNWNRNLLRNDEIRIQITSTIV